jgi:hypothetical protein
MGEADHVPTQFKFPGCAGEKEQQASRTKTTQKAQRKRAMFLLTLCSPFHDVLAGDLQWVGLPAVNREARLKLIFP